jgi:transposase
MPKKYDFKLTESELLQIAKAIHTDIRPEVQKHAKAIQLLSSGQKPGDVAERFAVQPVTIYNWFHRFCREGYDGLTNQPRGRPKRKADQAYCQALEEAIAHNPDDYGYDFATWTAERLRDHLEKVTGTHISISRLRMVIRNRGYRYRHPKRSLAGFQDHRTKEPSQEDQRDNYLDLIQLLIDNDSIANIITPN